MGTGGTLPRKVYLPMTQNIPTCKFFLCLYIRVLCRVWGKRVNDDNDRYRDDDWWWLVQTATAWRLPTATTALMWIQLLQKQNVPRAMMATHSRTTDLLVTVCVCGCLWPCTRIRLDTAATTVRIRHCPHRRDCMPYFADTPYRCAVVTLFWHYAYVRIYPLF